MHPAAQIRCAATALLLLMGCGCALAQTSALPATQPTAAPPPAVGSTPILGSAPAPTPAQPAGHRAVVRYADGKLEVSADNSSLNQVLRDIARQTGMTITGGVADERVFGRYGPASPAVVLAILLDGTGSNMLLRETALDTPAELVLTPRQGGPTPPNPNAPGFDDDAQSTNAQSTYSQPAAPSPSPALWQGSPGQAPAAQAGQSAAAPTAPVISGFTATPPADDSATQPPMNSSPDSTSPGPTQPTSPNGVKTPQQIFQQLQQLQQQQPANPK